MEERKFLEHTEYGRTDKFEIVEIWPMSHEVWHIGREHFPFEGYIPLCVCDANYHVGMSNLKCVKVDSEEMAIAAMHAAHHCAGKANREWFEEWRERFLMDFEQKCKYLVGKKVRFATINTIDKLATREKESHLWFISHGFIDDDHANFWVKPKGYSFEICVNYSKEFINQLVVDGIGYEKFCDGYYRNYFLK